MSAAHELPVIEVRVVYADREQESRAWTWLEVEAGGFPDLDYPDWMVEPRKTWNHSRDPVVFSTLVEEGREAEAHKWLVGLGGDRSS